MQDIFGSLRRSLVVRTAPPDNEESPSPSPSPSPLAPTILVDNITSCIRKSRVFSKPSPPPPPIRWRKGELIGCSAFGHVYMGMNLDSGELLAVKQVLIAANSASKEKAQEYKFLISRLPSGSEEEVKLLKNLSHPNIVRYLGTVREEETLNILLEFVPGGSISSLLGKFGPFPEVVIRTYTKQLLLGLEYLLKNGIMLRDIKGANILVDNKGCIKLADFGASKQATVSGAKSMKGTPYWMAPEVILQTGHSFSADRWSVGCTVIEMATGKPPWSQQYQEVAVLFYIGTTKSHPPIPEHLSVEGKDFLLKCLQHKMSTCLGSTDLFNLASLHCTAEYPDNSPENNRIWGMNNSDDDMCQIHKDDFMVGEVKPSSSLMPENFKSFNPICEPSDDWGSKFDGKPESEQRGTNLDPDERISEPAGHSGVSGEGNKDFSFPCGQSLSVDDDELTESKIRVFFDEKALELKKLQTPLYEEFNNSLLACSPSFVERTLDETTPKYLKLPPKSRSPSRGSTGAPSPAVDALNTGSPGNNSRCVSNIGNASDHSSQDVPSPPLDDWKGRLVDAQQEPSSPSMSFFERQRKWKEERICAKQV